jgi:YVTN family beta-propeller protein
MGRRGSADASSAHAGRGYAIAATVAAVAAIAALSIFAAAHSGSSPHAAAAPHQASRKCKGPVGAAYVSDTGYDGFSAIETANCLIVQTYNVADTQVPGDDGDFNYSGTNEGIAVDGQKLYFADAGNSTVAVINTRKLNPENYYDPPEKLIHVRLFPQDVATTPDGKQVWVADTGPQTSAASSSDLSVIATATNKVVATMRLGGGPAAIVFSPSGAQAYVTTSKGLWVYDTATRAVVAKIPGLGDPHGVAVSPNGKTIYVTDTEAGVLDVIDASTDTVTAAIKVGMQPLQVAVSAHSGTVYVADADSDAVSVINPATDEVTKTITVTGDPDALALTPNGTQLWVGQNTAGTVTILNTSTYAKVGTINLGDEGPQSGDGLEPTAIVLVKTPTPNPS